MASLLPRGVSMYVARLPLMPGKSLKGTQPFVRYALSECH